MSWQSREVHGDTSGRVATGSAIDKDAIGPPRMFHSPQWHHPLPARGQAADLPALAPPSPEQLRTRRSQRAPGTCMVLTATESSEARTRGTFLDLQAA